MVLLKRPLPGTSVYCDYFGAPQRCGNLVADTSTDDAVVSEEDDEEKRKNHNKEAPASPAADMPQGQFLFGPVSSRPD